MRATRLGGAHRPTSRCASVAPPALLPVVSASPRPPGRPVWMQGSPTRSP
jgi:hypothetical protein